MVRRLIQINTIHLKYEMLLTIERSKGALYTQSQGMRVLHVVPEITFVTTLWNKFEKIMRLNNFFVK